MSGENFELNIDRKNLYRQDVYTDLKAGTIRRMVPVNPDGTEDRSRTDVYIGSAQVMTPEGPLPLESMLPANNFEEAMDMFPQAMKVALEDLVKKIEEMQRQAKKEESRIIMPDM